MYAPVPLVISWLSCREDCPVKASLFIPGENSDILLSGLKDSRQPIIVCRPRKTNFGFLLPFAANKRKFALSVFCLQKTNENCCFFVPFPFAEFRKHEDVDMT
jgi:hypothetical protein